MISNYVLFDKKKHFHVTIDISRMFTTVRVIGLKSSLIYVCVIVCSDNGLEPNRRQIIALTDIDISSDS